MTENVEEASGERICKQRAGRCICSFGGGKAGEGEKTCACVMSGGGNW